MKSYIRKIDHINSLSSVALVQVLHDVNEKPTTEAFGVSVSKATDNDLAVVQGSASVIEAGKGVSMVRCLLKRTEQIIPLESNTGMVALSANMYMDQSERMWAVRQSESGDVLVRQSGAEDNEALINLIRSVSSASPEMFAAQMPTTNAALLAHENTLRQAKGGDMASYVSESGNLEVGFIAAQVEDLGKTSFLMVSQSGVQDHIDARQLVAVLDGENISGDAFPPQDSVSAALGTDVNKLVDYYTKVFSYRPDYLAMLVERIKNHTF